MNKCTSVLHWTCSAKSIPNLICQGSMTAEFDQSTDQIKSASLLLDTSAILYLISKKGIKVSAIDE